MSINSKIETWNPVTGCTKISPGCAHCYAKRMARRLAGRYGYPEAPHEFDVTLHPERLSDPLYWRKPRRVFVCSMSDLFHDDVPFQYVAAVFGVMAHEDAREHTFQVLTKRPERMLEFFTWLETTAAPITPSRTNITQWWAARGMKQQQTKYYWDFPRWPNVWLGVTVCTPDELWKLDVLRQCPAKVRYVSFEPLLADVVPVDLNGIDWVICGGESGPGARPMHPTWARSLQAQCAATGTAFFFKQWGAWAEAWQCRGDITPSAERVSTDDGFLYRVGKKRAGRLLDGFEYNEFPIVQYP